MAFFWIIIAVMTIIALGFLIIPLLRRYQSTQLTNEQLDIAIYKQRLQILESQFRQNKVARREYEQARLELERGLLLDVDTTAAAKQNLRKTAAQKPSKLLALALFVLIPIIAISLYLHWGASAKVAQWLTIKQQATQIQAEVARLRNSPDKVIAMLRKRLEQTPQSAKGWYLLGKLYLGVGKYKHAEVAFAKANHFEANNPEIMIAYAQALFFANDRKLTSQAQQILQNVLKLSANNVQAINLLAIGAYREGNYGHAIEFWRQLLAKFPPNSNDAKELQKMIADAQAQLRQKESRHPMVQLKVHVILAEKLKHQVASGSTVFVFAKAINGPKIPLAVARISVGQLPTIVTLDDSKAMLANNSLSTFNKVVVVARISKSGNAIAQKGDLQGKSKIVHLNNIKHPVNVVIDNVLSAK